MSITGCVPNNWADVNGVVGDGCEVDLQTSTAHCGSVGNAVPANGTNHATYACSGGHVVIVSCEPQWADVDGQTANGCEQPASDPGPGGDPGPADDPDPAGNTPETALFLGSRGCDDVVTTNLSGAITSPGDHDYYLVIATGGACDTDFGGTFNAPPGIAYDVLTDLRQVMNLSAGTFSLPNGSYSPGARIFIHVHGLPGAITPGGYALNFHL